MLENLIWALERLKRFCEADKFGKLSNNSTMSNIDISNIECQFRQIRQLCNVIQLWFFQFLTKIITFSVLPNFCTGIVATLWLYTKKYCRYNLSIYWWKNIIEYSIYCFHVRLILLNNYSAFRERLDLEWDTKVKLIKLMEVKQPILCLQSFS